MAIENTPRCPQGWWPYQSSCYQLSHGRSTWECARQDCESKRAHLVIFNNDMEEKAVRIVGSAVSFWIGLSVSADSSTWTWVDGRPQISCNWGYQPYYWRACPHSCAGRSRSEAELGSPQQLAQCGGRAELGEALLHDPGGGYKPE
ncbi:C-type lectin domain family 4 member E-like isoform X1 [Lates japonicus]|uniref:C-type lectin domain family 4 member E-like isoform X1 n=1 Tax=Lates japonicus TaxID=270547 RepID=A0AAD3R240_LATJO|nr:C-type lectin domain family 4 member E-like isoform X1 [Lates japonicus]